MSNITGLSNNFGFEFMAVAMTKRSTEAQGKIAMSLLEDTAQSVQQINASAQSNGRVGSVINTKA